MLLFGSCHDRADDDDSSQRYLLPYRYVYVMDAPQSPHDRTALLPKGDPILVLYFFLMNLATSQKVRFEIVSNFL